MARDEDEIEYIALSYSSSSPQLPRVVWKQAIVDVEATNNDMTGNSTKLIIPKPRLRHGNGPTTIRSDWNDVHVYAFAPWVRKLIVERTKNMVSIQQDLIPLLISRQFKGRQATFGKSQSQQEEEAGNENSTTNNPNLSMDATDRTSPEDETSNKQDNDLYSVLALVVPNAGKHSVLRGHTTASYLFANKEVVSHGSATNEPASSNTNTLPMPIDSKWNGKFQTLVLTGKGDGSAGDNQKEATQLGAKITMKSSVIGKHCTIGSKCRLNNVVIMDNVTVGENCSLQNTIIGSGATLGNNCSLNDCQVGPGAKIPTGTKEKGETFEADGDDGLNDDAVLVSEADEN